MRDKVTNLLHSSFRSMDGCPICTLVADLPEFAHFPVWSAKIDYPDPRPKLHGLADKFDTLPFQVSKMFMKIGYDK